jgi:hypothetical protein
MTKARNLSLLSTVEVGATADQTKSDIDALGIAADITAGDTAARAGRKNFIINGGFDVWQRGTTGAQANGGFVADRWKGNNYTTGTFTFSQRTDATGQTFRTYGRLAQSSAGSNALSQGIMQYIEGLHLVGKTVTVSFKVRGNAALSGCKVRGIIAQQTFNLTTDWVKHSFTGTAIQNGSNTTLVLDWGLENTTWHVDIAEVQVEVGSVATDFEHRSYGEELALCQRYYYQVGGSAMEYLCQGDFYTDTQFNPSIIFPVTMRTAPSFTQVSGANYFIVYRASNSVYKDDDWTFWKSSPNVASIYGPMDASSTQGHSGRCLAADGNAKLMFSAEL